MRRHLLIQLLLAATLFYAGFWLGNNGSTAPVAHGAFESNAIAPAISLNTHPAPGSNLRSTPVAVAPPEATKPVAGVCSPAPSVRPAAPLDSAPALPSDEEVFVATWCSPAENEAGGAHAQPRAKPLVVVLSSLVDELPGGSDEGPLSALLPALAAGSRTFATREVTVLREGGGRAADAFAARGVPIILPRSSAAQSLSPAAASLYVQRMLGCVLSRTAPDLLLTIGGGTVAAAGALAAASHGILVASIGGSGAGSAQMASALQRGQLPLAAAAAAAAAAALHFPATQFGADSLVQAGACSRAVLPVGSLAVDAAVAALAAPPSPVVRNMLVALHLAGDTPDNSDAIVVRSMDLASMVKGGRWPSLRASSFLPLPEELAAGATDENHGQPIVMFIVRTPLAAGFAPAPAPVPAQQQGSAQQPQQQASLQRVVVGAEAAVAAHVLAAAMPQARIVLVLEAGEPSAGDGASVAAVPGSMSAAAAWPADSAHASSDAAASANAVNAAVNALVEAGAGMHAKAVLSGGTLKSVTGSSTGSSSKTGGDARGLAAAGRVRIMHFKQGSAASGSGSGAGSSSAAAAAAASVLTPEQRAWLLSAACVIVTDDDDMLPPAVALGRRAFLLSSAAASSSLSDGEAVAPLSETAAEALASGTVTLLPPRAATIAAHIVAWAAATGRTPGSPSFAAPPASANASAAVSHGEQLPESLLPPAVSQAAGLDAADAWGRELAAARSFIAAADTPAGRWPVTSYLQTPAMELVARGRLASHSAFGDGRAALRLVAGMRALFDGWARLQPQQRGPALRDLLLCRPPQAAIAASTAASAPASSAAGHAGGQGQALSLLPPPPADHTLHSPAGFTGRLAFPSASASSSAVPTLLDVALGSASPGQRRRRRVQCSAQPPTRRGGVASYAHIMGLRSAYPGPDAIAPRVTPVNDPLDVAPSPLPEGQTARPLTAAEEDRFAVTAVVAVYRRPQFFLRLLWALGNQTHKPREVWITTFGSKHEDEFRRLIREHDPEAAVFKFVAGDPNFKYFGRFALATMAKTPYVALFDDDCLPGRKVLANLLHTANAEGGDYATLLGMKGHGMETEAAGDTSHGLRPYYAHWVYRPEETTPVDLAGGVWFARTEWLRHMWRETPSPLKLDWRGMGSPYGPWETGEDFQLSYSLRKFLNLPTLLFPSNLTDPDTWGASPDYFEISSAGDTTGSSNIGERSNILYANIMKGYVPARTDTMWGETHRVTNVAVLLPSVEQAGALSRVVTFLRAYFHSTIRLWPVVALDPRAPGVSPTMDGAPANVTRDSVLAAVGMRLEPESRAVGVFDLKLAKAGAGARWRPADIAAEVTSAMAGVLEGSRPAALIVPWDDEESPVALAAAMTASSMRIPVLGYAHPALGRLRAGLPASPSPEETTATLSLHGQGPAADVSDGSLPSADAVAAAGAVDPACVLVRPPQHTVDAAASQPPPIFGHVPLADADGKPHGLCAVRGSLTFAHGPVGFATNSQVLLVRQLFDTLCSCERMSSSGVGTYARCPDVGSDLLLSEFAGAAVAALPAE